MLLDKCYYKGLNKMFNKINLIRLVIFEKVLTVFLIIKMVYGLNYGFVHTFMVQNQ
jgi:hypothetical protein